MRAYRDVWTRCRAERGALELRGFIERRPLTQMSSVAASTTSLGRQFQSLIVLGSKEELLYCVLVGISLNCLL